MLLIIADDLGWGDIGSLRRNIPTPHIDNLAREGALFTNFHTAATCSPSRAMLLTGVNSHLARLGKLFQAGGYITGFFGKWHQGKKLGQRRVDAFAFAPDLVPTLLDSAGITHPATGSAEGDAANIHPPSGRSAWPILRNKTDRIHPEDEAIGYERMATAALFRGDYKLVRNGSPSGSGEWMLFDLALDPGEREDLSDRLPVHASSLKRAFDLYAKRVGGVPIPDGYDVFEILIAPPRSTTSPGGSHPSTQETQ